MQEEITNMPTAVKSQSEGSRVGLIVRTCKLLDRMGKSNPDIPKSHGVYYRMLAEYYTRILNAQEEGRFIAAHTVWFPVELLYAMDIVPMHTEITAWMTALFTGNCADLLSASAAVGMAQETCSPYRVLTGALATRAIPRPGVVLSSNLICDNNARIGPLIQNLTDRPGYFVDCPFQESAPETAYLKEELRGMVRFLEEKSGHKMDWDRLRENVTRMDQEIELARQIDTLRQNVPSPFMPADFLKLFTADCLFAGEPQVMDYLATLHTELADRVKAGKGINYGERFRILSIGIPPVLSQGAVERTHREFGAVSVVDPYSCTWEPGRLDADDPLDNVIRKISLYPSHVFYGPLTDRLTEKVTRAAKEHKVDGAIFYAHVGCRQSAPAIKLVKDALNAMGIPILILDCDIVDVTVTPEDELCHKLRQFFELLEDR
jgi:benzoyl-CoA reductase/2-hydroxyglutaryl-CoA dehydratase subunit BcrC/BadD/HgdB